MVMKLSPAPATTSCNGFEPVINTATQPLVLVANPALGVKTLPELIAAAKAGKPVSYASPGAGSPMHIVGEWLNHAAGVKFTHVPIAASVLPSPTWWPATSTRPGSPSARSASTCRTAG